MCVFLILNYGNTVSLILMQNLNFPNARCYTTSTDKILVGNAKIPQLFKLVGLFVFWIQIIFNFRNIVISV